MRFHVQASGGNADGIFDAAYDFGSGVGDEAEMHGTPEEIGKEVTRLLAQLTPEDCQAMRYDTPVFFIQLTITPEGAPSSPAPLPDLPDPVGPARPDNIGPSRGTEKPSRSERNEGKKVHEMIELLKQCPLDALLVQARDAEGNCFSPVYELTQERYVSRNTWEGELAQTEEGSVPAVVLWPAH
jgi:hypothetical protein